MSVPKFKRLPSGLDYVDNAYELQKEIMTLASKLSARWARIYQQPIDNLACKQADFVNMAYSINCQNIEDIILVRKLHMIYLNYLRVIGKFNQWKIILLHIHFGKI